MDKYDYITATIEEEKVRVEKILEYLEKNPNNESYIEYKERYNNICTYLNAKKKYFAIADGIKDDLEKLDSLNKVKDEYELDNILMEDTLLSKFHDDTNGKYKNLLYENIKYEDERVRDILYLLYEKQNNYKELTEKRKKLKGMLRESEYPNTYNTLISQDTLIEKEEEILNEIFLLDNSINMEREKLNEISSSVMTTPILKILYEFWIVDSYDEKKVNRKKLFKDNRTLVSIKNNLPKEENIPREDQNKEIKKQAFSDLKLPNVDEDVLVAIDGKNYIKNNE